MIAALPVGLRVADSTKVPSSLIAISTAPALDLVTVTSTSPLPCTSALSSRISTLWARALAVTYALASAEN
jgi:hypothetical protein